VFVYDARGVLFHGSSTTFSSNLLFHLVGDLRKLDNKTWKKQKQWLSSQLQINTSWAFLQYLFMCH